MPKALGSIPRTILVKLRNKNTYFLKMLVLRCLWVVQAERLEVSWRTLMCWEKEKHGHETICIISTQLVFAVRCLMRSPKWALQKRDTFGTGQRAKCSNGHEASSCSTWWRNQHFSGSLQSSLTFLLSRYFLKSINLFSGCLSRWENHFRKSLNSIRFSVNLLLWSGYQNLT